MFEVNGTIVLYLASGCRFILRFMLCICGLSVRVRNEEQRRDACPVVVCNHISPVDRLIFSLVQPNIIVSVIMSHQLIDRYLALCSKI